MAKQTASQLSPAFGNAALALAAAIVLTAMAAPLAYPAHPTSGSPPTKSSGAPAWYGTRDRDEDFTSRPLALQTFKTHSRFSVRVPHGTETRWRPTSDGFELLLKYLHLTDIGAPMSGVGSLEQAWVREQEKLNDSRVGGLKIRETPEGIVITGNWRFPKLANPDDMPAVLAMDRFEFREDSPPRYFFDFWQKMGQTVAQVRLSKAREARELAQRKSEEDARRRAKERKARERARVESDDVQRFCERPFSEMTDIVLPFRPVHDTFEFSKHVSTSNVDASFTYFRPKPGSGGAEADYVRLALELYDKGKLGLAIKTVEMLNADFPRSNYRPEMHLLKAAAQIKLGVEDVAVRDLSGMLVEFKDSPVAIHIATYLAIRSYENQDYLQSLETFLWLIANYPEDRKAWLFHMGAAEVLFRLKETNRAAIEYQWVVENGPTAGIQAEATSRIGDLFMERREYERAVAVYGQLGEHFKTQMDGQATALVNRGEANFWLKKSQVAEDELREFLKRFPNHQAGWRAYYRLGELVGGREGDENRRAARKHFEQTINRFPFSPGATLARVRLAPCGDHGGLDRVSAERFFADEALEYDGGGEVQMERYRDFVTIARVRTLITLGDYERAVNVAVEELKKNLPVETRYILSGNLGSFFRKTILQYIAEGREYEALEFYYRQVERIPEIVSTATQFGLSEFDFLLSLARIAADLGMGGRARELAGSYQETRKAANRSRMLASKEDPREIDIKLRTAEESFTISKAIWVSTGLAAMSEEDAAKIRGLLGAVPDESTYSFEREVMLGLLDEKAGRHSSALTHAAKAHVLHSEGRLVVDDRRRFLLWLGEIQHRVGDTHAAIMTLRDLETLSEVPVAASASGSSPAEASTSAKRGTLAVLGLPGAPARGQVILREGEMLAERGLWAESVQAYARAVETGTGGNQAMYQLARSQDASGDRDGYLATLGRIATGKSDDFWRRLAVQVLASHEYQIQQQQQTTNAKEGNR